MDNAALLELIADTTEAVSNARDEMQDEQRTTPREHPARSDMGNAITAMGNTLYYLHRMRESVK